MGDSKLETGDEAAEEWDEECSDKAQATVLDSEAQAKVERSETERLKEQLEAQRRETERIQKELEAQRAQNNIAPPERRGALPPGGKNCPECGVSIMPGYPTCPRCKATIAETTSVTTQIHSGGTSIVGRTVPWTFVLAAAVATLVIVHLAEKEPKTPEGETASETLGVGGPEAPADTPDEEFVDTEKPEDGDEEDEVLDEPESEEED